MGQWESNQRKQVTLEKQKNSAWKDIMQPHGLAWQPFHHQRVKKFCRATACASACALDDCGKAQAGIFEGCSI